MSIDKKIFSNSTLKKVILCFFLLSTILPAFNYVADRIAVQWIFLSSLLLISTIYLLKEDKFNQTRDLFQSKPNKYIFLVYSIFILTSILSIVFARNKIESLVVISQYITVYFCFIIIINLSNLINGYQNFIYKALYILLVVELIFIISPIFIDIESNNLIMRSNRYIGLMSNINITAFSILYKIPVLFYFIENTSKFLKYIFHLFILFLTLFSVSVLGSRASLIAILCLFTFRFLTIVFSKDYRSLKFFSGYILTILISIILNFQATTKSNVVDRFNTIENINNDSSINQRLKYYGLSMKIFKENPLTGIGVGNWKYESINKNKFNTTGYIVPFFAHNDFLQILNENGLLGLLSYISIFIIILLFSLKKIHLKNYVYIAAFFGIYFIDAMLNFPIGRVVSQIHFIVFLSLFLSLNKLEYEKK